MNEVGERNKTLISDIELAITCKQGGWIPPSLLQRHEMCVVNPTNNLSLIGRLSGEKKTTQNSTSLRNQKATLYGQLKIYLMM